MNHSGDTNKMVGADHLPDATKMVSDTPRTDAEECEMFIGISTFTSGDVQQAFDFARQLERELAAANDRIKRLEEESESDWHLAQSAIGSCAEMSSRIQRLEKAGDALYLNSELTRWDSLQAANRKLNDQEAWRKAKEDKP